MSPRKTRPKRKPSVHEHLNKAKGVPIKSDERPTNPLTLAIRRQENVCPDCVATIKPILKSQPAYRFRDGSGNGGYCFIIMACPECNIEWAEKYILGEVSFIVDVPL